jgi:hypothetical protein
MNPYLYDYLASMKKILLLVPHYNIGLTIRMMVAWITSIRWNFKEAGRIYGERKNEIILQWLEKRYGYLVPEAITPPLHSDEPERIFVFWWQGTDGLPDIVRICINSIKQNSNGREVVMITKDNIRQWADVPHYIFDQVSSGAITITHLSDILRVCLLYQHGGYWIDATVFMNAPLNDIDFNPYFGSIKIHDRHTGTISAYRWTGFFLHAVKGSTTMKTFRDILFEFWKTKRGRIIDYLLIDYTFEMLYRKSPDFRRIVDDTPYTNEYLYELVGHLSDVAPINQYFSSVSDTHIFKLTWRNKFPRKVEGKDTMYGQLIDR